MNRAVNFIVKNKYVFILGIIVILAIFLRFYHLGANSIWLDEGFVFKYSQLGFKEIWSKMTVPGVELNPPFYYWLIHLLLNFGQSEWLLRFPAALAGIFTVLVFYFIGKEIRNPRLGLVLASLLAFSPFHLYYSQEGRAYTLALLFFSLGFYFYLKTLKNNNPQNYILFGIFSGLSIWSHYYVGIGLIVLFAHGLGRIIFLKSDRAKIKNYLLAAIIFLIISLPLIIVVNRLFFSNRVHSEIGWSESGWSIIKSTIFALSGYSYWAMFIFLILLTVGIVLYFKKNISLIVLIITSLVIPLLFSVYLSGQMPMTPRYLIYLLPIFFLGVGLIIDGLMNKNVWLGIIIIGVILIFNINYYSDYYHYPSKFDWRGAAEWLTNLIPAEDSIVVIPSYLDAPLSFYYPLNNKDNFFGADSVVDLEKISLKKEKVWYLAAGDILEYNKENEILNWFDKNTKPKGRYSWLFVFAK